MPQASTPSNKNLALKGHGVTTARRGRATSLFSLFSTSSLVPAFLGYAGAVAAPSAFTYHQCSRQPGWRAPSLLHVCFIPGACGRDLRAAGAGEGFSSSYATCGRTQPSAFTGDGGWVPQIAYLSCALFCHPIFIPLPAAPSFAFGSGPPLPSHSQTCPHPPPFFCRFSFTPRGACGVSPRPFFQGHGVPTLLARLPWVYFILCVAFLIYPYSYPHSYPTCNLTHTLNRKSTFATLPKLQRLMLEGLASSLRYVATSGTWKTPTWVKHSALGRPQPDVQSQADRKSVV